jgi:pyruvyltransferase
VGSSSLGQRASSFVKDLVKSRLGRRFPDAIGVRRHRKILDRYEVNDDIVMKNGSIPVFWWTDAPNFGDLLSPWLVENMTGMNVEFADRDEPHYVTIGSIVGRASNNSIVWGTGSFGTETKARLSPKADYTAVRGPLTRQVLKNAGISSPQVYGDPALLMPLYYYPEVPITHEIGVVVRWSEKEWKTVDVDPRVKIINLKTANVEDTIVDFLSCRRIISSSLHGLIIADAYGIPNAWRQSETGKGGIFKYFDYFASVHKYRAPHQYSIGKQGLGVDHLLKNFSFDSQPIDFKYYKLLDASPFLQRKNRRSDSTG